MDIAGQNVTSKLVNHCSLPATEDKLIVDRQKGDLIGSGPGCSLKNRVSLKNVWEPGMYCKTHSFTLSFTHSRHAEQPELDSVSSALCTFADY